MNAVFAFALVVARWSGYLTRIMDTIFRFRLHPAYSSIVAPNPKMTLGAQCLFGTLRGSASKSLKIVFFSSVIGVMDGLQARYFTIGSFGNEIGILYQVCYLTAAGAAAYFCLHNKAWSAKRNMLNLMVSIPVAMIGDNVSIDAQKLRPYLMLIPNDGFLWRDDVFGHTFLSPVASWVNQQTLASGLIDGYLASIGVAGCYLVLQYFWSRHNRVG